MNIEGSKLIKKTIWSIVIVTAIFIVAFIEVPRVYRDIQLYYFLGILSIGAVSIFFSDLVARPNYKTVGQKLAFHSIPILFLVAVVILKVVFNITNIKFVYYVISTLLLFVMFYSSLFHLNKGFNYINQMEVEQQAIKVAEGIKKIRMDEVEAQVRLNPVLAQSKDFKDKFELLVNEIKYANPTELLETQGISNKINTNIEKLSEMINEVVDEESISDLKQLAINTRLLVEEKNKIAQLYYKKI